MSSMIDAVSNTFHLEKKTRLKDYIYLRRICYKLCKELNPRLSLSRIGKVFNRDHATVLNGLRKFDDARGFPDYDAYYEIHDKVYEILTRQQPSSFGPLPKSLELIEREYRVKHIILVEKSHKVICKLMMKLDNIAKRDIFKELSELDDKSFEEFEVRAKAFLEMNKLQKEREARPTY